MALNPKSMTTTVVSAQVRHQIDQWASQWLTSKFSRTLERRALDPGPFNYPVDVFPQWRGRLFYLSVRYRARSRRPDDDFIVRQTRMTPVGFDRVDLA